MTRNTSLDRRIYRAERILAVRTAIRASRGALSARLQPRQKQRSYIDHHDQTKSVLRTVRVAVLCMRLPPGFGVHLCIYFQICVYL